MKVYIASKYCEHKINQEIYNRLTQLNIPAFLPESINRKETSLKESAIIRDHCANEIKQSTVLLAIDATDQYGSDVGWEVGYAYALKTELNYNIKIINLKLTDIENIRAMNDPSFDQVFYSVDDAIEWLKDISISE